MAGPSDDEVKAAFESVAAAVRAGDAPVTNQQKLELYALFKQATEGDVAGPRPGLLDPVGRAKWDAWRARSGLGARDAMVAYIQAARGMGLL